MGLVRIYRTKCAVGVGDLFTVDQYGSAEDAVQAAMADARQRLMAEFPKVKEVWIDVSSEQENGGYYASAGGVQDRERVEVPVGSCYFESEEEAIKDAVERLKQEYPGVMLIGYGVGNHGYNSDINYYGAYAYGYALFPIKK